jgi:hypothetical protein
MANEAVIIELLGKPKGRPIRFTVADATAVDKGDLCKFADPRLLTPHAAAADVPFAGIAATEKVTLDGQTSIAVWTNGLFDIIAAAAGVTPVGNLCALSATANMITATTGAKLLNGSNVGQCLEAHANNEVACVRVLGRSYM